MEMIKAYTILFLAVSLLTCQNPAESDYAKDQGEVKYKLEEVASGLVSPVGIAHAGDGSGRVFILEQPGEILILENGKLIDKPFLDINKKVVDLSSTYSEKGLLGLAFHPDYENNRRFFVYYSAPSDAPGSDHKSVISEFKTDPDNPNAALPEEKVLLTFEQPESNHNGGNLAFGPDGFLYIATGDGGGAGDKHGEYGNAQNLGNLLGKILRINVDKGDPYSIPEDNPFQGPDQRGEIYAYGLRNPWRFSFDPKTGQLFAADVGQNKYEEVDIIEKGKNYGWRYLEGFHVYDASMKDVVGENTLPVHEYNHDYGISVIGGYIYRGKDLPELEGAYVFGDWNGKMRYIRESEQKDWPAQELVIKEKPEFWINSFGVNEENEIYIAGQKNVGAVSNTGVVYKLVRYEETSDQAKK